MSAILELTVRYFQDSPPEGKPFREEFFIQRQVVMGLPRDETALVLVDLWDNHFIESWLERADCMTREGVVPVLEAARAAAVTVVHAPSPNVAPDYPEHLSRHSPSESRPSCDWPPPEFRRREGEYYAFRGPRAQPPGIPKLEFAMSPHITVEEADELVETGQQLHELCHRRQILHLIYVGFATNWCVLNRDYGMRAMAARGYNLILLRDATMGVEFPDTLGQLTATEMAIREAEQQLGFSATRDDLIAACASC